MVENTIKQLKISAGQYSDKGRKEINQDFYATYFPKEPLLTTKGIVVALADGISSSNVSQIASQTAVTSFIDDYYCTSEAWSVKKSAQRVLMATNSWLHTQTRQSQYRYDLDRGYVCTLSAIVIKSTTAHIFHAGDSRVYQLHGNSLEQLTNDHRLWISREDSYLSNAMGFGPHIEIDYRAIPVEVGDIFVLATDGVYEYVNSTFIASTISKLQNDLNAAAKMIVVKAFEQGSVDNLTVQIVRIDALPNKSPSEVHQQLNELPPPPILEARSEFDGYTIIREVHASSRSHVYLARDNASNTTIILKTPSQDLQGDPTYLERFLMEEWIARRINSPHVLKPCSLTRKRHYLYIATEFIEGQTLTQWIADNPKPELETVRGMIEQIAKGLRAFHRLEMLHQDLRPNNIMIDSTGTLKIIDFGSTQVAGVLEISKPVEQSNLLGTAQYTAPEYFLGESGSPRADLFSLGVITYQMLSGKLPYGVQVATSRTRAAQRKLRYKSLPNDERQIPIWVDEAIKKAVHPNPNKRYAELSEFLFDLRNPNQAFLNQSRPPLMERSPSLIWKVVSLILAVIIAILLIR